MCPRRVPTDRHALAIPHSGHRPNAFPAKSYPHFAHNPRRRRKALRINGTITRGIAHTTPKNAVFTSNPRQIGKSGSIRTVSSSGAPSTGSSRNDDSFSSPGFSSRSQYTHNAGHPRASSNHTRSIRAATGLVRSVPHSPLNVESGGPFDETFGDDCVNKVDSGRNGAEESDGERPRYTRTRRTNVGPANVYRVECCQPASSGTPNPSLV